MTFNVYTKKIYKKLFNEVTNSASCTGGAKNKKNIQIFYDESLMNLIQLMLLSCHICRPQYLPCSGVASLAGIVYGLSSGNCLCSLSLTINEPNYKLQTTNKPQGRKYTIFKQNASSTRYHCWNEAAIEVQNWVCLYRNGTLPLKFQLFSSFNTVYKNILYTDCSLKLVLI